MIAVAWLFQRPLLATAVLVAVATSAVMGAQSLHGDWPGRAMSTVEAKHPEVVALHINGCSGDQNPLPRRTIPLLEKYGDDMAAVFSPLASGPVA